jgi:uncharacterized lipoprotein NlpE involved in copper resistance
MNTKLYFSPIILSSVFMLCCNEPAKETTAVTTDTIAPVQQDTTAAKMTTADNSQTSLDWPGTYKGVVPCADCEGIETTITIGQDSSYTLTTSYLGKKDAKPFEKKGKFIWDAYGSTILLSGITNAPDKYKVGENVLIQLDMSGNTITGDLADKYRLQKIK